MEAEGEDGGQYSESEESESAFEEVKDVEEAVLATEIDPNSAAAIGHKCKHYSRNCALKCP